MRFVKNLKQRTANKDRRQFLDMVRKAGVSTALLKASPLVMSAFATRHAQAANGDGKRVVFMYLPDGASNGYWLPESQTSMNVATRPYGEYDVAKYCEFHEVTNTYAGHGNTHMCMGINGVGNPVNTLDAQLAQKNFFTSPREMIHASVQTNGPSFTYYNGSPASYTKGPTALFNEIFNGAQVDNTDTTYVKAFEMNAKAIASIKKKLGAEELARLDTHLETLQKIETSLAPSNTEPDAACSSIALFDASSGYIVDEAKAVSDIVIAAFKCGITNVATIMLNDDQAGWEPRPSDREKLNMRRDTQNYHNFVHSGGGIEAAKCLSVLSEVPAYFIDQLARVTDMNDVPLINSTLFCQGSDMGEGDGHSAGQAPWILASTSSEFGFSGFRRSTSGTNEQLLRSIPQRMGLDGALRE